MRAIGGTIGRFHAGRFTIDDRHLNLHDALTEIQPCDVSIPFTFLGFGSRLVCRLRIAVNLEVSVKVLQFPAMTLGFETEDDALSWTGPDRFLKATWVFVWLGVLLRVVTFALNFPLWGDEAFVAVNLITRGYRDLLRPLDYAQICPLLFLWLELTAVKLLGFSEWSLRLIPTIGERGRRLSVCAHRRAASRAGQPECWRSGSSPCRITRSGTAPRSSSTRRTCWHR